MSEKLSEATGGVNGYAEVREQLRGALELLERAAPETLFTLGGDCSVELAPISYLNRRYPDLGVVWFDAHADLQVPATSPSGDLQGMPLRLLLGEGEKNLKALLPSSLRPEQVLLAGVRALDPEEEEVVARLGGAAGAARMDDDVRAAVDGLAATRPPPPPPGVGSPHTDPVQARRMLRRILLRLDGMGKYGGFHTEFRHLARGFAGDERALALAAGEALVRAGLLTEKPSVGHSRR